MNIKEVKIMMHLHIHNMEELTTKEEIADFINQMIYEDPEFFGQIDKENILDVREFDQPDLENRETD
jgi:hypothetical protein